MKEIPILYSTAMIQAKLAGRKNQTRRIVKPQPIHHMNPDCHGEIKFFQDAWGCPDCGAYHWDNSLKCPYGKPGDMLYARETHYYERYFNGLTEGIFPRYRADFGDEPVDWSWRPNIFLHKEYCRIWDRVVSVRVERLQDITESDAIAEGIEFQEWVWGDIAYPDGTIDSGIKGMKTKSFKDYMKKDHWHLGGSIKSYQTLWQSINGEDSWELNPWVWVITTENVSLTGKPV